MTDQASPRTSARRTRRQLLAAGTGVRGPSGVGVSASSQNGTAQKVTGTGRRASGRTARLEGSAMAVRWRGSLPVLVIVFLIFAVTSCSSQSSSQAPPGVGEAFAARATTVCQRALQSKQAWSPFPVANFDPAHPDPSAFPKAAVWLEDQVAPTFEAWLHGLRALGTPPKDRQAWNGVLAAVATIVQGNADEIAAAKAGDTQGFVAARDRLIAAQPALVRATAAAGVPTCADVHKA